MKKIFLFLAFFLSFGLLMAQVPQGINYQTVIRDANLDPVANQTVSFLISFTDGANTEIYTETHQATTDELGMVHLILGAGTPSAGTFDAINWSLVKEIEIDLDATGGTTYENLGTLPLQSVPYALLAQDVVNKDDADADPANEIQVLVFDPQTGELSISNGNAVNVYDPANLDKDTTNEIQVLVFDPQTGELSISNGNAVNVYNPNDNDQDDTNELQTLAFDSATATLSISAGNQVVLPTVVVPDADADPTNELQNLGFDTLTRILTISDGNEVFIPGGAGDADADPTNELQNLGFDTLTRILTISDGNEVFIPAGAGDNDGDPTNELQGLFMDPNTGDLTISEGNTVNVFDPADLDKDPTNEIQQLVLDSVANTLTISGGNTVQLPAGGASQWQENQNDIYFDAGNVGIGRISSGNALEVEGTIWSGLFGAVSTMSPIGFSLLDAMGLPSGYFGNNSLSSGRYNGLAADGKPILFIQEAANDSCCVQGVFGVNRTDNTGLIELFGTTGQKVNAYLGSALGCSDCGSLELWNDQGPALISGSSIGSGGYLLTYGTNGQPNAELGFLPGDPDQGALLVANEIGLTTALFGSTPDGGLIQLANGVAQSRFLAGINNAGSASILGVSGGSTLNFILDNSISNPDWGFVGVLNDQSQEAASLGVTGEGEGLVLTFGTNGNPNVAMASVTGHPNSGFAGVFDSLGNAKAGMFVDATGQGTLFADVKNFRVPNPMDPNSEIWYASLEGPEVAAYTRGVETLENGQLFVAYPDYFAAIVDPSSVTVILTPHEWDTYGLAVVEKKADGFVVRELKGGTGNFSFDWEVKGVRKGHENFDVIRPRQRIENDVLVPTASSASTKWKESLGSISPKK